MAIQKIFYFGFVTNSLLAIWFFCMLWLSVYALVILRIFLSRSNLDKTEVADIIDQEMDSIDVIIPSHDEGLGPVETIKSLINQTTDSFLHIYLILKDRSDSSIDYLKKEFSLEEEIENNQAIYSSEKRIVKILFYDQTEKFKKINFAINNSTSSYIAFIDADHVSEKNWIKESLDILKKKNVSFVQSIRKPKSIINFFSLWDSLQNHIGNEQINVFIEKRNMSAMFTGTTAIFRREIFDKFKFENCLTEDTMLSYQILSSTNLRASAYHDQSGSREEVSSDFFSYVSRRRRWANGHTKAFYSNLRKILSSHLRISEKCRLLLHGNYYLVLICVNLVLWCQALFINVQLSHFWNGIILGLTLFFSLLFFVFLKYSKTIFYSSIMFIWPQLTFLISYGLYLWDTDLFFSLLEFPYLRHLFYWQVAIALCPLLLLLKGLWRYRYLKTRQIIALLLTYPFAVFIDIYCITLGLTDYFCGYNQWSRIGRTGILDQVLYKKFNFKKITLYMSYIFSCIVFLVSFNEFFARNYCGVIEAPLYNKVFFVHPKENFHWTAELQKKIEQGKIYFTLKTSTNLEGKVHYEIKRNGEKKDFVTLGNEDSLLLNSGDEISTQTSLFEIKIFSEKEQNNFCKKSIQAHHYLKKVNQKKIYLNEEPFLIKCVIPTFFSARNRTSLDQGMQQIKSVNANMVRFYRPLSPKGRLSLEKNNLFSIDQTYKSNWDNINLNNYVELELLNKLAHQQEGAALVSPMSLLMGMGNEIELNTNQSYRAKVLSYISSYTKDDSETITSYSTNIFNEEFGADLNGVNILDSGDHYWDMLYESTKKYKKASWASEFGIAYFEENKDYIQWNRVLSDWNKILKYEMNGGCFFSSHDNWSQPLFRKFNDPLTQNDLDEARGIWDIENKPRLVERVVKYIYQDVNYRSISENVIEIENIRDFGLVLNSLNFVGENKNLLSKSIKIPPKEKIEIEIPEGSEKKLRISYVTHQVIHHTFEFYHCTSKSNIPCVNGDGAILNNKSESNQQEWTIYGDAKIKMFVPSSWSMQGNKLKNGWFDFSHHMRIEPDKFELIPKELNVLLDSRGSLFSDKNEIIYTLNFKNIGQLRDDKNFLVLSNISSNEISLVVKGRSYSFSTHPYRELSIDLNSIPEIYVDGMLKIVIENRNPNDPQVHENPSFDGSEIKITRPYILNFKKINITKNSL